MKVIYVVTDNIYYYAGVKHFLEGEQFMLRRIEIIKFMKKFESEDINDFYFLAGPDTSDLLCRICDFRPFKLLLKKDRVRDIIALKSALSGECLHKSFYVRKNIAIQLSGSEFSILMLFMKGYNNKTIALMKNCSVKFISALKFSIRRKFHCHSDMDLMKLIPLFSLLKSNLELRLLFVRNSVGA
jgi:DNA-binding NarL/FixJ family response regulator